MRVQILAHVFCPLVNCDLGVTHVRKTGLQDSAARPPAHHRGKLFSRHGIDHFAFGGGAAESQPRDLGIDRDVQHANSFLDVGQAETKSGNTRPRLRYHRVAVILGQTLGQLPDQVCLEFLDLLVAELLFLRVLSKQHDNRIDDEAVVFGYPVAEVADVTLLHHLEIRVITQEAGLLRLFDRCGTAGKNQHRHQSQFYIRLIHCFTPLS